MTAFVFEKEFHFLDDVTYVTHFHFCICRIFRYQRFNFELRRMSTHSLSLYSLSFSLSFAFTFFRIRDSFSGLSFTGSSVYFILLHEEMHFFSFRTQLAELVVYSNERMFIKTSTCLLYQEVYCSVYAFIACFFKSEK